MLNLRDLVATLTKLNWDQPDNPANVHTDVRKLLAELYPSRDSVARDVGSWSSADLREIAELSRETTTHYKWSIARDPEHRFIVWLHQYKPEHLRRPGYATVAHNHRYAFSSLILNGGLVEAEYQRAPDAPRAVPTGNVRHLQTGDCYSVMPDEIHAMTDIMDLTITLIVQGSPVRTYSEAYDLAAGTVNRYNDFIGQYDQLRTDMLALQH